MVQRGSSPQKLSVGYRSVYSKLGKVEFDLVVIPGTRAVKFILSQFILNLDDDKVSKLARFTVDRDLRQSGRVAEYCCCTNNHPIDIAVVESKDVLIVVFCCQSLLRW